LLSLFQFLEKHGYDDIEHDHHVKEGKEEPVENGNQTYCRISIMHVVIPAISRECRPESHHGQIEGPKIIFLRNPTVISFLDFSKQLHPNKGKTKGCDTREEDDVHKVFNRIVQNYQ
jgi:hypothetical protein